MLTGIIHHLPRRLGRALVVGVVAAFFVLGAGPAGAYTPEGWPQAEPVSTLTILMLLVGGPVALFAVITLLVYVPSMARGERYTPGRAWHNQNEWFGGPRGGVEASDTVDVPALTSGADSDQGGASARW